MRDAQKPDHISLNTLISRLKEGRFVIPDFQREFEWEPGDIRDLMRSIFLDYYIGSLLLWKGKDENFSNLACEPVYGFNGNKGNPEHIVLDGQQRITAIYYTFVAPNVVLPQRSNRYLYFLRVDKFMAGEHDDAFFYYWTRAGEKLIENESEQFERHIFPLSIIGKGGWELPNWVQGYERYWKEHLAVAEEEGDNHTVSLCRVHLENAAFFSELLKGITEQFQIAFIELDRDLELEKVCDIFTQINSKGIQLDVFDLINALLKPKGLQLKHMWRDAAQRLEFVDTTKMNVYILQVMSILKQGYCSPKYLYYMLPGHEKSVRDPDGTRRKEILVADVAEFKERWWHAVESIEKAIEILKHPREYGVISSNYLPYVSIIPAFSSLQAHLRQLPSEYRLKGQAKISHWYWASVFLNRYSGSVESTAASDFRDVIAWIENDAAEPQLIQEFKQRFKDLPLRTTTQRGFSIYNGIFNLFVLQGARDWIDGTIPQHGDLDDHHIVPVEWGAKNLQGKAIHTILNRTPLTAETNRHVIGKKLPNEYLPELIAKNGENKVREILDSHFISEKAQSILLRNPFTPADFEEFISERQKSIHEAIENLIIKERIDLPPRLRDLDRSIEKIELETRRLISSALNGNLESIPPHILQRIEERIARAKKKNAAMDSDYYETLSGKLEFFDLRELQDTIVSKALWERFADRFGSKEALIYKFDQLAELRNGIRHSRMVDDIVAKEGEAAILWFEKVFANPQTAPSVI